MQGLDIGTAKRASAGRGTDPNSVGVEQARRRSQGPSIAPKKIVLHPPQESEEEEEAQPEVPAGRPRQGGTFTRSGRQVKAPTRKGNVYGETKAPTEIIRETAGKHSWEKKVGESSRGSRTSQTQRDPGPSSAQEVPTPRITTPVPQSR